MKSFIKFRLAPLVKKKTLINVVRKLRAKDFRAFAFIEDQLYKIQVGAYEDRENAEAT